MNRHDLDSVNADADILTQAATVLRRRGYTATASSLDTIADGMLDRALRDALLRDSLDRTKGARRAPR